MKKMTDKERMQLLMELKGIDKTKKMKTVTEESKKTIEDLRVLALKSKKT